MSMTLDVNDLRVAVTVLSFFAFAGIWAWAWSRKNAAGFAEAAQLPFVAEEAVVKGELAAAPGRPKQGPTLPEGRSPYPVIGEPS
ncbi:hypothetical protein BH11PSE8_BH11PSE8_43210 [soil metagenome]